MWSAFFCVLIWKDDAGSDLFLDRMIKAAERLPYQLLNFEKLYKSAIQLTNLDSRKKLMVDKKEILKKLIDGKNAFRIITSTMTTWILMIAIHADRSTPARIVLDLVVFAVLLLMSYVFASVIGEEIVAQRQTSWKRFLEIALDVSPVLSPTLPPFLIFAMASFGIVTVKTGLILSDISLLTILFLMGFLAGKAIGKIRRGLLDGVLAAGIGVGLVILRSMVI